MKDTFFFRLFFVFSLENKWCIQLPESSFLPTVWVTPVVEAAPPCEHGLLWFGSLQSIHRLYVKHPDLLLVPAHPGRVLTRLARVAVSWAGSCNAVVFDCSH